MRGLRNSPITKFYTFYIKRWVKEQKVDRSLDELARNLPCAEKGITSQSGELKLEDSFVQRLVANKIDKHFTIENDGDFCGLNGSSNSHKVSFFAVISWKSYGSFEMVSRSKDNKKVTLNVLKYDNQQILIPTFGMTC